jgi:hypothetical protein
MYAIVVFECLDDVIHVPNVQVTGPYVDGKGWPGIQHHHYRPLSLKVKSHVQAEW